MKAWLKGGLIGGLIGEVMFLISSLSFIGNFQNLFSCPPHGNVQLGYSCSFFQFIIIPQIWVKSFLFIITGLIIGSLIGITISWIIKRNKSTP